MDWHARFPIRLNLPEGSPSLLAGAREAVRREFRDSVKWKRLRCRGVQLLSTSTTGSFYVRPFEFLAFLNAVFHDPSFDTIRKLLPSRLSASEGGIHPDVDDYREVGLVKMRQWWGKCWSVLWGPPGNGCIGPRHRSGGSGSGG